jgi:uncharacterized protein
MELKNAIIAILVLLLVTSTSTSFVAYQHQQRQIVAQEEIIEQLLNAPLTETEQPHIVEPPFQVNLTTGVSTTTANIVAVRSDTRSGVLGTVRVEVKEGTGNVLVNTDPFVEPDTQFSVREAVEVAAGFTNLNITTKDIIISFDINGTLIGGPSAGAATTVATVAALQGRKVRQDVAITGTIEAGGYIGQVGGVFDKAVAAEKSNISLFLVPYGQKKVVYYEQQVEEQKIFGFSFTRVYYTPKEIDLGEYMRGAMAVEEVATIAEAVSYMVV